MGCGRVGGITHDYEEEGAEEDCECDEEEWHGLGVGDS